jgi:hypothetical protein
VLTRCVTAQVTGKLTTQRAEEILKGLKSGQVSRSIAADALGVSEQALVQILTLTPSLLQSAGLAASAAAAPGSIAGVPASAAAAALLGSGGGGGGGSGGVGAGAGAGVGAGAGAAAARAAADAHGGAGHRPISIPDMIDALAPRVCRGAVCAALVTMPNLQAVRELERQHYGAPREEGSLLARLHAIADDVFGRGIGFISAAAPVGQ